MVRKVVLVKYETILQSMPFIFFNHVPTWDVSKFYHWQVEQPHQSRIEIWIPCIAVMVYIGYCLFSSCGIPISIGEVYEV